MKKVIVLTMVLLIGLVEVKNVAASSVFSTKGSILYHKSSCSELGSEGLFKFESSQKAKEAGGKQCPVCHPDVASQEYEMVLPANKYYTAKRTTEIKAAPNMKARIIHVLNPKSQVPQVALLQRNGRTQWIKVELNKDYDGYISADADSGDASSRPVETERIAKEKRKKKSLFGDLSKAFKFKVNGKEVDLAEKLGLKEKQGPDSRYPSVQSQQRVDSRNSSSKNIAVKRKIAKRSAGPIGPEVIGLRIGMTPDEARSILNARGFLDLQEDFNYRNMKGESSDGKFSAVLKEKYLQNLTAGTRKSGERVNVSFTQDPPGNDRIVRITRDISKIKGGPTIDSFDRTVIEKYGTPTESKQTTRNGSRNYIWVFDCNGALQRPGLFQDSVLKNCFSEGFFNKGVHNMTMNSIQSMYDAVPPQCGSITMTVHAGVSNMLVTTYFTLVRSYDEFYGSSLTARERANTYAENEYNRAIKSGDMVKPDF